LLVAAPNFSKKEMKGAQMELNTNFKNKDDSTLASIFTDIKLNKSVLICFSHLRWDFVYQRPQHLMTRFSSKYNILYLEEPIYIDEEKSYLEVKKVKLDISIIVPHISKNLNKLQEHAILLNLLDDYTIKNKIYISVKWYLTPIMLEWSQSIQSDTTIYDCMDELSAFKNAPLKLKELEQKLILTADLVFTGGASLYKAKRVYHKSVHLFPSSVDITHFIQARNELPIPEDQKIIEKPCIGFYGVIDERFDIELLRKLATSRLDWNFVIIGPVVKIDINELPKLSNIHYLGKKSYDELPNYLSCWDVAFIPFAINESTKFISPTKTPEYLAAGLPVVSTTITDIIATYRDSEIVHIADPANLPAFIDAIELALKDSKNRNKVYQKADLILQDMSWDKTFNDMYDLILGKQQKEAI
jgi:glycosyltransferase involved in cell wall biosynthesis